MAVWVWIVSSSPLCHHHQRRPTRHPPPKQLLRQLEAGGVSLGSLGIIGVVGHHWGRWASLGVVGCCWASLGIVGCRRHPPFPFPPCLPSCLPSCLPFQSSFHPPSTPRAVAREAGGGCCAVVTWQRGCGRPCLITRREKPKKGNRQS